MGPQLNVSLCGELLNLEKLIVEKSTSIEHWLRDTFNKNTPPFYSSIDLRNACFKIAPVDTNLFPAGFNNLGKKDLACTVQAFMTSVEKRCPDVENVLLIPENHTRNKYYLDSLGNLYSILSNAGLTVRVGSIDPEFDKELIVEYEDISNLKATFKIEPLHFSNGKLKLNDFDADLIIVNNDFSSGIPPALGKVKDQIILPTLDTSWAFRRKSNHFEKYDQVAKEFCKFLGADDWLINPMFEHCQKINFRKRQGEDCLSDHVTDLLKKIQLKYNHCEIKKKPFVVVKADAGTYGMGVMTIRDPSEIKNLNRRQRNKMSKIKGGVEVSDVLIQEGVYSFETYVNSKKEFVAEPVVYVVDRYVVGGFYRVHSDRGLDENLNAPGMQFFPLPFENGCQFPALSKDPNSITNRLYFYGVIARLAAIAASKEKINNESV